MNLFFVCEKMIFEMRKKKKTFSLKPCFTFPLMFFLSAFTPDCAGRWALCGLSSMRAEKGIRGARDWTRLLLLIEFWLAASWISLCDTTYP